MIRELVLTVTLLTPIAATAQELPTVPYLPLERATKAAQAALEACAAEGSNVSVAIVARSGATQVLLKADNSGAHTASSAEGKAFTAAALGRDTAGLAEFIASKPANDGMRDMDPRMVIQAGGLPVKFGDALVAGIGVGGAPSGDIDAKCAAAGLKAIGAAE
ncbi:MULTISPECIES: heme-binding protein [unclassified Mesorhizobium]|uniref:GlcG/HbpS family heme-binding protein n=1 Tax=unclassified Mesorhizobium TaxID=325217 RepID=UPI0011285806|nr:MULTISPECIES: heme-binding protein [unclassified Mesorhizobium]MBZ9896636.1 heme-binding protein [Mesorhizobium sp. BR1-1-6]MCA0028335.1 heme-binding protein [Mesorhizobium sp. B263B1A]TPJ85576.1 heme-binding protein [Mesorhizobium sp. B2-5-12]TPK18727.1 heme-binding protein [Mesorhizobium sp. B2-5-6]TPN28780.1 heme-binding protein [Mesorhizobium sp. B1-1-6]